MPSQFENAGLGMFGREKSYVNNNNPLSTALGGLKDFGIMYGMDKAGVFDYLNKVGEQKQAMMDKYPALSGKKPAGAIAPSPSGDDYASWDTASPAISGAVDPAAAKPSVTNNATLNSDELTPISEDAANNLFKPIEEAPAISNPIKQRTTDNAPFKPLQAAPPPQVGFSGVSPNALEPRNPAQDETAMQAQYASNQNPNQSVGQGGNNGGGEVAQKVASTLLSLFLG